MKENAIIIEGKQYDYVREEGIEGSEACEWCEFYGRCFSEMRVRACELFGGLAQGHFRNTKEMAELNLLLKGRMLYRNGRKVGDVTAVYRDTYWRVDEPYIYYLFIGSERHSFTYSDIDALLRGDRVVYDTGDLLGSVNAYELKCGEGGAR